jgi:beta-xylosidase
MRAAHANVSRQGPRRLLLAWLCSLCLVTAARAQPTYDNPVVAGDFPDPTVIRTGQDYWAATTSGGWAPLFQILHSRDLVNWRVAGSVFRESPDWPTWARGDYWAPELSEHRGRFYVYYTARRAEADRRGTLCVAVASAGAPAGPYTDHGPLVCQEAGSIDAYATTDERGRRYLLWKEDGNDRNRPTPIWAQPLSEDGLKLEGEPKELIRNDATWERHVVEGPYVFRRGGWFYLFYSGNACCGRGCNYALGVARSQKLLGPWEKFSGNPILKANEGWQCPGHGTAVETPDGRLFMLYHAYRRRAGAFNVGREMLLDEVKWRADGWPEFNGGRGPSASGASPLGVQESPDEAEFFDDFLASELDPSWQYPLTARGMGSIKPDGGGSLVLRPSEATPGAARDEWTAIVVARRPFSGDYVATTRVRLRGLGARGRAGVAVYSWRERALGVAAGGGRVYVWRREGRRQETLASAAVGRYESILLRVSAAGGESYRFAYSADGRVWKELGAAVPGGNVEGARVALTAGGTQDTAARFDWFRIVPAGR